jgi:translocation and assembly module TamB
MLLLLFIAFLFISGYAILSGRTFYADFVAEKVRDAMNNSAGIELAWDSVRGNPVTGVFLSGAKISFLGDELATADEIGMRIALTSIASSTARLSQISFSGLSVDWDRISIFRLPGGNGGSAPVDSLYFTDSSFSTPWGLLSIKNGSIGLNAPTFRVDFEGFFLDIPFSIDGKTDLSGNAVNIRDFEATFGKARLAGKGRLMPSLEAKGEILDFDTKILARFFPSLDRYNLSGLCSATVYLTGEDISNFDGIKISGNLISPSGNLFDISFENMSTNFYYSDGNFQFRNSLIDIFEGKISAAADLKIISGDVPFIAARIASSPLNTQSMANAFPWIKNFAGTVEVASCDIAGPINSISAKTRLSSPSLDVASFSCSDVTANIALAKSKNLKINFLGNIQGAPAKGTGNISIGENAEVNVDVSVPKFSPLSLQNNFPQLKDWKLDGFLSASLNIKGPASDLSYNVLLSSPELSLMGDYRISEIAAEMLYAKNTLDIKSAHASWQDATLSAEGTVSVPQKGSPKLSLGGKFSNLNISRLNGFAAAIKDFKLGGIASGSWSLAGDTSKPVASVDIALPKFFIYGKYMLNDLRASARYEAPVVNLSSSAFRLGASSITAAGNMSLATKEKPLEYNFKGSFKDLDPATFVAMGLVSQDISGKLNGDARIWKEGSSEPSFRAFFKNSAFQYAKTIELSAVNGTVTYSNGNLQFDKLSTNLNNGGINLDGRVGNILGWQQPSSVPLNLTATVTSADIDRVARIFNPESKGFQGLANGTAIIKGNMASPSYTADGTLRSVRAFGLFLPIVNFKNIKGNKDNITFPDVKATVGRGSIEANGSLDIASNWDVYVKASGTSVDIRSLTVPLENEMRREITGALDFNFEGKGPLANFKGKGHGHIPNLSAFGIKMSNVDADISIADGYVMAEDSSARAYGGNLNAQVVKHLETTVWGGRIDVASADMASLFKDLSPDSEGSITGTANFSMRFTGDSRRTSMQDGNGKLEVLDGEVIGFEGTQALSKALGGKPLRFHSAHFSFTVDGKTVNIIPGSRISAPKGDPAYKYVTLDGSVTTEQEVDLSCMGNVNIRALNAFAAGIQGVLTATVESGGVGDSSELLRNFLGNTISGYSRNEFRDVSLRVSGKPGDMKFSNIAVTAPIKMDTMPSALKNPDGYKGDEGFKVKVEIPVGPGGEGHSSPNIGGQIGGQLLDQLLKGIVFDDE